jgi:hypothetical protein
MKKKVVKYRPTKTIKGKGFIEDADKFLKNTKLISKVAQVALPFGLGALGTVGGPLGTAVLGAVGQAGVEGLKNYGYGVRVPLTNPKGMGSKSMMRGGQGGGYQGSEYQNMTTALYSHKPSMRGKGVGQDMYSDLKTGLKKTGKFIGEQNDKLKKSKIISTVARNTLSGNPYGNTVVDFIDHLGYGQRGGAVYSQGQIPIHKNTGAGATARDYKTRHMVVRKPIMVGGGVEGMSVYNDVVSQFGNPKF